MGERLRVGAGALGLGAWALASVEGWSAIAYLSALHGDLGRGMLPALCALWGLLSALPCVLCIVAAWPALRPLSFRQPANWGSALALGVLFLASGLSSYGAARVTPSTVAAVPEDELLADLRALGALAERLPAANGVPLLEPEPVGCATPPAASPVTLFAVYSLADAARGGPASAAA